MKTATLDIAEARRQLASLDSRLKEVPLIWVTRNKRRAFAVVSPELMDATAETLEILGDPNALQLLGKSLADIREGRIIDHEEIGKEVR